MTKEDEIEKLLMKANRHLNVAKDEFSKGNYDVAVSRAYYAMFYCAEALLLTKDLRFSKHSGVHAAFGEHFAKTGEISPELHRMLLDAFNLRGTADYHYMKEITEEEARKMLNDAEIFISGIKEKLEFKK